jgi:hypothetical protein
VPAQRGKPARGGWRLRLPGRLPRPDGAGSFLYLAGIHAPGILGAAQYVADNIAELHRELRTRRFSVLISCQFDPADRRKILSTGRLTA